MNIFISSGAFFYLLFVFCLGTAILWNLAKKEIIPRRSRFLSGLGLVFIGITGAAYTLGVLKLMDVQTDLNPSMVSLRFSISMCGLLIQFMFAAVGAGLITNSLILEKSSKREVS
ncbi:MAG TPA: hypothetical protein VNX00_11395 [Herbaspirillum sp.]|jgi:hypothetical protein|nr:hypothetical protein [Herbaspirillum sp.]